MAGSMKGISKMAKRMEKAPLNGLMETSILGLGRMGNNMELGFGGALRMTKKDKGSGLMERDIDG
jgi:hypothetical protein